MSEGIPDYAEALGGGVYAIDTGFERPRFDAAYLMVEDGHAAFIDTGTNFAVPRLLGTLRALGLAREAVDWVIPTHVHLDHAGGVGLLMRELPRATMLVHPRGLRHMVDPSALRQGATAVYGEEAMRRNYGELLGVDPQRATATQDGMVVKLGTRPLLFADTPGHARHHHCIWDEATRGWFSGDSFGLSYREFDTAAGAWILPSATPVQFDPEPLRGTIERLMRAAPRHIYLTHFGRVPYTERLGALLLDMLQRMVDAALPLRDAPERHVRLREALRALYLDALHAHGCILDEQTIVKLLEMDIELNSQGVGIWLDRR